jgi:hypothetical protein
MNKPFEKMDYKEKVDWAAGLILERLVNGDFRGGVGLVLLTALNQNPQSRYVVPDNEKVEDAALSPRAIKALSKRMRFKTAKQVRTFGEKQGFETMKKCPGVGTLTMTEIKDYYLSKV